MPAAPAAPAAASAADGDVAAAGDVAAGGGAADADDASVDAPQAHIAAASAPALLALKDKSPGTCVTQALGGSASCRGHSCCHQIPQSLTAASDG